MSTKCKKGEIWRVGYSKRTSKKDSKSKIIVKGKCIKATSQTGQKTSLITKRHINELTKTHKLAREKFGTPKCKRNELVKEGYRRKSKSGKQVWVAPSCMPAKGKTEKREQTIYIEPGRLSKYGYDDVVNRSDLARHNALKTAFLSGEKPLSVSRRLTAISTLTKNTNPRMSHVFKGDAEWIKMTDEYKMERGK